MLPKLRLRGIRRSKTDPVFEFQPSDPQRSLSNWLSSIIQAVIKMWVKGLFRMINISWSINESEFLKVHPLKRSSINSSHLEWTRAWVACQYFLLFKKYKLHRPRRGVDLHVSKICTLFSLLKQHCLVYFHLSLFRVQMKMIKIHRINPELIPTFYPPLYTSVAVANCFIQFRLMAEGSITLHIFTFTNIQIKLSCLVAF